MWVRYLIYVKEFHETAAISYKFSRDVFQHRRNKWYFGKIFNQINMYTNCKYLLNNAFFKFVYYGSDLKLSSTNRNTAAWERYAK